jgi:poly-gamma-glutamate synthesis protein (capsule biosynthesis protein)
MRRRSLIVFIILCLLSIILAACELTGDANQRTDISDAETSAGSGADGLADGNDHVSDDMPSDPAQDSPPQPYTVEATLVAVGDIMVHNPQLTAAYSVTTATYSFDDNYVQVAPILKTGDWVIGNLETTLAGPQYRYSGYPVFNSPDELADALVNAGFNILGTANNHTFDKREAGVLRTLEQLRARNIIAVGTNASPEERDQIQIVTKNNIDMALLAYTYGTNGIIVPADKPYLVNMIDEDRMKSDITKARELGADVVTVMLHYGNEYDRQPSKYQKELARKVISWGADVILGSHTHIVQPYEFIETADEQGIPRRGVVIYSLGNFISNQGPEHDLPLYTDVGVIFKLTIRKHYPEETIELGVVETIPTWVHKYRDQTKRHYRILPLEEVLSERDDKWLTEADYKKLDAYLQEMTRHLHSMAVPVSESSD